MAEWLDVPSPAGDVALLERTQSELQATSAELDDLVRELMLHAQHTGAQWAGQAAEAFRLKEQLAEHAVRSLASAHDRAAAAIDRYRQRLEEAWSVVRHARQLVRGAITEYGERAREVLDQLVAQVRSFIHSTPLGEAVDWVAQRAAEAVPFAEDLLHKLTSWATPDHVVQLVEHVVAPVQVTASAVLNQVRHSVDWGISHLLHGAEQVLGVIGHAASVFFQTMHEIEQWFADTVAAAIGLAVDAVTTLVTWGVQVAVAVYHLALWLGGVVFDAVVAAVEWVSDAAVAAWNRAVEKVHDFLMKVRMWIILAPHIVTSFAQVFGGRMRGRTSPARMKDRSQSSDEAKGLWRRDRAWRKRVRDSAMLAQDTYDTHPPGTKLPNGWTVLEQVEGKDGFHATVYRGPDGDVILGFRGSEPGDARDWHQDALNMEGLPTSQGSQAIALAQRVVGQYGPGVTMTGHSLGGGLAAVASIATGQPAVTFNASGIGDGNHALAIAAGGAGASEHQITNFHTPVDLVTGGQELSTTTPAAGAQITIASTDINPIDAHSMESFNWDLEELRIGVGV